MSAEVALAWVTRLTALAVILQSVEALRLWPRVRKVWSWRILRHDYTPIQQRLLTPLLGDRSFPAVLVWQLLTSTALLITGWIALAPWLLASTLLVCLRWRGNFNGGSDSMTIVLLSSLTLAQFAPRVALLYLATQTCLSYLVAGLVKLRHAGWRNGSTLAKYLRSPYYPVDQRAQNQAGRAHLMRLACWLILLFECGFGLFLVSPQLCLWGLALGFTFHAINARVLGLNRFLHAWVAAYPALYYCSH